MKKLWLHSVRTYLRIGMFFYFKRIEIHGLDNVPKDKAVLLLANHQNALLDALLIATKCGRFSYFLTRAAVFKKSFVSMLLKSLQMLPVYRIRDGWSTLTNNKTIFETCTNLLFHKEAVVIFPEGSHNLARRVRPLSKGFTRIVFATLEKHPELNLQLVPVGFNFVKATHFPDSVSIYFGKAMSAQSFNSESRNEAVVNLKERITSELSLLTTHIPEENYNDIESKLESLHVNYLRPKTVNACIQSNFSACETVEKPKNKLLNSIFKSLLIINNLVPFLVWKFVVKPKIKELEFVSTFRFAIAVTLVPLYLFVVTVLLSSLYSVLIGVCYLVLSLVIALFAVKL